MRYRLVYGEPKVRTHYGTDISEGQDERVDWLEKSHFFYAESDDNAQAQAHTFLENLPRVEYKTFTYHSHCIRLREAPEEREL